MHLRLQVWTFKSFANDKLRIHLIVTKSAPAQSILRETATTGKVNFLSWNKAYSVFPLPTFIQYKSYLLQPWNGVIRSAAQNESRGGWNIQGVMWPEEKHINHPMRERRRVGDRYTWIIPFDTREVEWSKTPDYVLEYACFTIPGISDNDDESYDRNKGDARYYHIKADALESQVLRHIYTTGDVGMSDFISRRLHSSTILELRMLDPAQRPTNYNQILGNPADIDGALENFDRPASWRYRDDEIPKWCEAYERSIKGSIAKEHES